MKLTLYSSQSGTYNSFRRPLLELQLHLDVLREELKLGWNLLRDEKLMGKEGEGSSGSNVQDKNDNTMMSNRLANNVKVGNVATISKCYDVHTAEGEDQDKREQNLGANEASMKKSEKRQKSMDEYEYKTPTKKRREVICVFRKTTPKSELIQRLPCHLCPKEYASKKALVKHLKSAHDGAVIVGDLKGQADRITCKICNSRVSRDLIGRHL